MEQTNHLHATDVLATLHELMQATRVAQQSPVRYVGALSLLEDQMCRFTADGQMEKSSDRVDALVWALTELSESDRGEPKVKML